MKHCKKEYYYPIVIRNNPAPCSLSSNIKIRKLTTQEKADFFGIKGIDFVWGADCKTPFNQFGHVVISNIYFAKNKGRCHHQKINDIGVFDRTNEILASTYAIIIKSHFNKLDDLVERINMAFKLLQPTSTGGYLGFAKNDTDVHYHRYPIPIGGPFDYLRLEKNDLIKLKNIYQMLEKKNKDNKLNMALLLFSRALENMPRKYTGGLDVRFLLLMIVLDLLYIPDNYSSATKMASRISNILFNDGIIHQQVCELYWIRNAIIHDGKADRMADGDFCKLTEIVWRSLNLYLNNQSLFNEDELKKIKIIECPKK